MYDKNSAAIKLLIINTLPLLGIKIQLQVNRVWIFYSSMSDNSCTILEKNKLKICYHTFHPLL